VVGEGSYGRVYYAVLDSGRHLAIKKLDASTDPENDNEFLTQVGLYFFNVMCTSYTYYCILYCLFVQY
jgi:hypothetical protein